ncbi:hypothetical protein [Salinivibrio sp. SS3]|nr:hypothetical protein [Salinivibrio sp. BNH]
MTSSTHSLFHPGYLNAGKKGRLRPTATIVLLVMPVVGKSSQIQ